jgi:undecaprenyl-diphosphatase
MAAAVHSAIFESVDRALIEAARSLSTPTLDRIFFGITSLGWAPLLVVLCVALSVWSWLRGDRAAAITLTAVGLGAYAATELLKRGFGRVRPDLFRHDLVTFAFPSGHAMTAVAVWGMLFAVLARGLPRLRLTAWILAPLFALLIGVSRVYLAVHWPTDVVGGWAFGAVLLCLGALALLRWPTS